MLVYLFSKTPLVLFYIFAIAGGLCAGEKADTSTVLLFLFFSYVSGTAFLIMIVCYSKTAFGWVENLVGLSFIKKYAPKKGKIGFFVLYSLLFIVMGVNLISMNF